MFKAKPIPMDEPICFEDWKAGIEERRRTCEEVASGSARRLEGSDDQRLRAAFGGKRTPSVGDLMPK